MFVKLSRRNLLTLLAKLEIPGSHCAISKPGGTVVVAEPDEIAYADRKAGRMGPETEELIDLMEAALLCVRKCRLVCA